MGDPRLIVGLVLLAVCFGVLVYLKIFGPRRITFQNPLKVVVKQDGTMIADDEHVSLDVLLSLVKGLQPDGRVVYYYRENPEQEPTSESLEIFKRVSAYAPALVLYDDEQFTIPAKPEGVYFNPEQ